MGYSPQELADRAEIHDVIVRYGWAIDTKDWALLDTCFT
ncbi:MAG: SnoaL-like domain, partial [Actinomycetota bacterium]|nr:SnoaL-like domain [Actinomycetota bacterium]